MLLLQNGDLLPRPWQRLVAVTFLYDMYRGDTLATNPFAPVFIHLLVSRYMLPVTYRNEQYWEVKLYLK